ncbi:putative Isopropylmalate/citramalate isomerase small subunit [Phycicoccus elongatus Lp2]|uniref:3-isopropylmalate dehydratase small subunit n=1 Tax=Phycicoccus elongatus Lp2 TaxID=1193181 RepID=N0E4X2_9MICO|nr:putative Isopropylmalate/citramalate isomerase small subunit [Phycicoccus elongatus]CCH71001.1 putative Isopropylmalate/citramalate isomerase small subunit [Phycicoccus elongatus Lp2]
MIVRGVVWHLPSELWDDLNTDVILPSPYLRVPEPELGDYAFQNHLPGFTERLDGASVVLGGTNFGCGSSREQAVKALLQCGVTLVVAESFGSIFFRNGLNLGLALIRLPGTRSQPALAAGAEVSADLSTGIVTGVGGTAEGQPLPKTMMNIIRAGGILPLVRENPLVLG